MKLFGRYWGALEHRDFLHFELCYYQGIEYALKHGLKIFEAGAQGEHKVSRGFEPTRTFSAHSIRHPGLHDAVANFVQTEKHSIEELFKRMAESSPFEF